MDLISFLWWEFLFYTSFFSSTGFLLVSSLDLLIICFLRVTIGLIISSLNAPSTLLNCFLTLSDPFLKIYALCFRDFALLDTLWIGLEEVQSFGRHLIILSYCVPTFFCLFLGLMFVAGLVQIPVLHE